MIAEAVADKLIGDQALLPQPLCWELAGVRLCLRSNSADVLKVVSRYMRGFGIEEKVAGKAQEALQQIDVHAYEQPAAQFGFTVQDWPREEGKSGRKDAWQDFAGEDPARLIYKVRTGMHFLQRRGVRLAVGPCIANDNQLINFINAQWMNSLQQGGALIGHAAALVRQNHALAIAGLSGGGKSTLMLKLLGRGGAFLSNDRLFLSRTNDEVLARGIAKWPRVNPGTIVHDQNLQSLIPQEERKRLLALPTEELRQIESKYDALIPEIYGNGHVQLAAPLRALLILNWQPEGSVPTRLQQTELRRELLPALMKSPGPFYQQADGAFRAARATPNPAHYQAVLQDIPVFELTGRIDFEAAADLCEEQCWAPRHA